MQYEDKAGEQMTDTTPSTAEQSQQSKLVKDGHPPALEGQTCWKCDKSAVARCPEDGVVAWCGKSECDQHSHEFQPHGPRSTTEQSELATLSPDDALKTANEAANEIADYFNAPPSVIPAIEQIILRCAAAVPQGDVATEIEARAKTAALNLNKQNWLLSDATTEELDGIAATIAEVFQPPLSSCNQLRQVALMALQQFEFQYGKRKRGWGAEFLMGQLSAAIAEFDLHNTRVAAPVVGEGEQRFALSGQCDNAAHSRCPYPEKCKCNCHATTQPSEVAREDSDRLLRSWLVCMRTPRPQDWERIVENLCVDTSRHLGSAAVPEHVHDFKAWTGADGLLCRCGAVEKAGVIVKAGSVPAGLVPELQKRLFDECRAANWDPELKNTFAEEIAHLHEELTEAFRAWRRYKDCEIREVNGKLEGVPIEFADVVIGLFYNAELHGFSLLQAVERKHEFNLSRNYVAEGRQLHAPATPPVTEDNK